MSDEEMEKVSKLLGEWFDRNDNLLELPISEAIGNAFFDAWELCKKDKS